MPYPCRKHSKSDSALVAQGKGKGKAKFSKENKSKKAPSTDSKEQFCDFCGRTGHLEEKCYDKRDALKKLKEASKEKTNSKNKQQPKNKGKGKDKVGDEEDSDRVAFIAHSSSLSHELSLVVISTPTSQNLEAAAKEE